MESAFTIDANLDKVGMDDKKAIEKIKLRQVLLIFKY